MSDFFATSWTEAMATGSSVHGISQARIMERVAISLFRGSSWPKEWICVSCIGRRILCHRATREAHRSFWIVPNTSSVGWFQIDFPTVFLCLTYFTKHNALRSIHVVATDKTLFFLMSEYYSIVCVHVYIYVRTYHHISLFKCWWILRLLLYFSYLSYCKWYIYNILVIAMNIRVCLSFLRKSFKRWCIWH